VQKNEPFEDARKKRKNAENRLFINSFKGVKMSVHKHNSWGRTRGPKNLAGPNGTAITVLADTDDLLGITASTAGYNTENQRFLHVLIEDATTSDDPAVVTVFGYCHAFQRWFEIPEVNLSSTNTAASAVSIDIGNIARAPALQVPSDREYRIYHIVGVDKVSFVNGTPAQVNVFAACSTF
tara:strand:- start:2726 stop:3268 length:543 start_codon:yes stop_codon:yes gene_type:complete